MPDEKSTKKQIRIWEIILLVVIGLAIVGGGVYAYEKWQNRETKTTSNLNTETATTSTNKTDSSSSATTDNTGKVSTKNIDDELRAADNSVNSVSPDDFDNTTISNSTLGL